MATYSWKSATNLLTCRLASSWNKELCSKNYAEEFKALPVPLSQQPCGAFVYLDDGELGVPEDHPSYPKFSPIGVLTTD